VNSTTTKKTGLVPFHKQHSLLMLTLLFTIFLAFCFLLMMNYRLRNNAEQQTLQNHFRERVKAIDGLLGNIRNQVRTLQLSAEANLTDRAQHSPQAAPLAFDGLRDNTEGAFFHLNDYRQPLTKEMIGNLTGKDSIQKRSPDFYRELYMALNLNHRFRAIAENLPALSGVYYLSKNDFINFYPWTPASEFRYSLQLKKQEFYRLSLPTPNPERQTFWTRAYRDVRGKGLVTTCSAPVYEGQNFMGTVAIDLTVEFLNSLIRDFNGENGSLLLINSDRQLLAHPTLIRTANSTSPSLQDVLPDDLLKTAANLESLPAWQLTQLGPWSVLQAPLQNASWQVVFFQQQPSQAKAFVAQLGGGALAALVVLLGMICTMVFLNHRHIVWPSEQLLHFINALNQQKNPSIDSRIPSMWRPWFENIENIFHDNQTLAEKSRQDIVILDQRVKERTIELERLNRTFCEEIEERSKAEGALRVVNQKLQELSLIDGLTGIPNCRKFNEYLNFCWNQMSRGQSSVSIIMCDVDHFKQFNAAYGQQAGDYCLQEIAHAIQASLQRTTDLVARYGSEEFIILLPGTNHTGAERVATSIQQALATLEIPHSGSLADSCVHFSIGIATAVPAHGGSPESLLEAADQSLYRAKETDRNQVVDLPVEH